MAYRALLVSVVAFWSLAESSPTPTTSLTAACKEEIASLSWEITDFEWRTGYAVWSYPIYGGPAPPPPPLASPYYYNCGEAMIRMNITGVGTKAGSAPHIREQVIPCVEQTNDAKLANITNMTDYSAGPWGPPPPSPHWFACDLENQQFIFPNGTVDPWVDPPRPVNLTTRIRMDPVKRTLEIGQSRVCDDGESGEQVEVVGIADLPLLTCRDRPSLEPDADYLVNSPFMRGPGMGRPLRNGSVCTGPGFLVEARV